MKHIILSTSLLFCLTTGSSHAGTETAEKSYQLKIDKATASLNRANDALSKDYEQYGVFHPNVAEDYKAISEAYFAMGEFEHAIEYALHALKVEMKLRKEDDPLLAKLYFDTGNKYYMYKEYPTAILYMNKALEIYKKSPKTDPLTIADTYESIASVYMNLEDHEKSLVYAKKCLELRTKRLSKEDEALQRAEMNVDYLKEELKKKK